LQVPNLVEIAGPNRAGKTSLMDSVMMAFKGAKSIDPKPVRDGEEKGSIRVETDDLVVERSFVAETGKTRLKVTGQDGGKYGQGRLSEMFTDFSFDPLAFAEMGAKDQVKAVRSILGDEFCDKLDALDAGEKEKFDERTLCTRELRRMGKPDPADRVERIDVAEVAKTLRSKAEFNAEQDRLATKRMEAGESARRMSERIESLLQHREDEIARIDAEIDRARQDEARARAARDAIPEASPRHNTEDEERQLESAQEQNDAAAAYEEYEARIADITAKEREIKSLTAAIEDFRDRRAKHVATANLPIEGMEFTPDGIVIDGIPFEQCSRSQRIQMSVKIGMSGNPELKIMFVRDGNVLDADTWALVSKMALEHGYQLWVERVGEPVTKGAIVIEDGEVVGKRATA
jgi:hypothetical protein